MTKKQCIERVCELIELAGSGTMNVDTAKTLAGNIIDSYAFHTAIRIANGVMNGSLIPEDIAKDIAKTA